MEARLRKLIELRTDGPVVAEALESLSALGDVSRHALQAGLEQQSLATAEAFLAAMEPLVADVTHLDASIKTLVSTASAASARVAQVGQDSAAFLGRAAGLLQQRAALDARYAEVNNFLARYELTAEEAAAISGGPGNDTATARRFYAALERVQRLQGEALGLVTGDNQAIGLELLDHAAVQLVRRSVPCLCTLAAFAAVFIASLRPTACSLRLPSPLSSLADVCLRQTV